MSDESALPVPQELKRPEPPFITPFETAVLDRLDRIIELLAARPAAKAPKPNVTVQETVAMGKTYVRETNHDTGEVRDYVKTIG